MVMQTQQSLGQPSSEVSTAHRGILQLAWRSGLYTPAPPSHQFKPQERRLPEAKANPEELSLEAAH